MASVAPRGGLLGRVKPLDAILATAEKKALKRSLGAFQLTLLGIGAVIGTGIFVLTAEAAQKAGPAMMISFVIAGFVCAVAALCYSELAAMVPVSGSAYTYTYAVMGDTLKYWSLFPAPQGYGNIPVWGFGEVIASRHPDIATGEILFGYFPMATHLVIEATDVKKASLRDGAAHRQGACADAGRGEFRPHRHSRDSRALRPRPPGRG